MYLSIHSWIDSTGVYFSTQDSVIHFWLALTNRVWWKWWCPIIKSESKGLNCFLSSLGLLPDLHGWREHMEQIQVSLVVLAETPETRKSLAKISKSSFLACRCIVENQLQTPPRKSVSLWAKWYMLLLKPQNFQVVLLCSTAVAIYSYNIPLLYQINGTSLLELELVFKHQRMVMHKEHKSCRIQNKWIWPIVLTCATIRQQN